MKLGLQLFTLIDTMRGPDGLRTVLRQAADAGYDGVDFTAFRPKKSARSWTRCT